MSDNAAGWQPDPTGKHDHRYWDGTQWTDNVADAGVAATDPYEAPAPEVAAADASASDPVAAIPGDDEPTAVTPIESPEPTATYPMAPTQPAAPPPYVPPTPVADGGNGKDNGKRGLVIGGAILAAVALAVIAFLALSGDDDEPNQPVADSDATTTTEASDEGTGSLEDLKDACADGDLSACDDLYYSADLGSDLETFGSTCGDTAEPQEGSCEATNGGEDSIGTDGFGDGNIEDILADTYKEMFDLSDEQAECLGGKIADALEDGSMTEEQVTTEIFGYLEDCDISLEDIGAN